MKKEEKNTGVSLFSQSQYIIDQDPIEEIFALNLGDFIAENLISKDLAQKISTNVKDKKLSLINQLKELISIYSMQNTLGILSINNTEKQAIFTSIAHSIKQMLEVENCSIYLEDTDKLELVGTVSDSVQSIPLNETTPIGKAFLTGETLFADVIAVPMSCNVKSVGVIVIKNNSEVNKGYIDLVESIAVLFATSMTLQRTIDETNMLIENDAATSDLQHIRAELTALIGDLCDYQQNFVENLAFAVDKKGGYKVSHSKNTANLARKICRQLNLNEKTTDLIYYAGLLQNIGKIALPEEIFTTNGKLSAEDLKKIQTHSNIGVHFLMNINFLSEVVPYITYQTEKYDGSGPEGLKGQSIPFGSRIISVADAYCAMTSDRPYRKAMPSEQALNIMKSENKWDPIVLNALAEIVR